jgi:hypothetical protein
MTKDQFYKWSMYLLSGKLYFKRINRKSFTYNISHENSIRSLIYITEVTDEKESDLKSRIADKCTWKLPNFYEFKLLEY